MWNSQTWKLFDNPKNTSPRFHLLPWLPFWDQTTRVTFLYFSSTCRYCKNKRYEYFCNSVLVRPCTLQWVQFSCWLHLLFLPAVIPRWSRSCDTRRLECIVGQWRRSQVCRCQWYDHNHHLNCLHTYTNPRGCLCNRNDGKNMFMSSNRDSGCEN